MNSDLHNGNLIGAPLWKRYTKLQKLFFLVTALFLIVIIALVVAIFLQRTRKNGNDSVCMTPVCIETATNVLKNINTSVDPCDDFYEFACGNFPTHNVLQDYRTLITTINSMGETLNLQLRSVFEEPTKQDEIRPFAMVKSLYQSCMDTKAIERESVKYLQRVFTVTGGWPVIKGNEWREEFFDWHSTTNKFFDLGLNPDTFFHISIWADPRNNSRNLIHLIQPDLPFSEKLLRNGFNESIVKAYYNLIAKVAIVFGAEERSAYRDMREVMLLTIELAKIIVPQEERRNLTLTVNPMTIQELNDRFRYVDWLKYINERLGSIKKRILHDEVIVVDPKYFDRLNKVLNVTSKRTVANYMYWNAIHQVEYIINNDIRKLLEDFKKTAFGQSEPKPRWKECVETISQKMHVVSGALYVRKFFNKEAKTTAEELVSNMKQIFAEIVKQSDWIDEITKRHALEKIEAIQTFVAYPDEILNDRLIEVYYKDLEIGRADKYLESILNLTKFVNMQEKEELDKYVDKRDWRKHVIVTDANAYYNPTLNSIEISAIFLQSVLFDNERPKYMNYGGIGFVIGHEITHGFDDEGSQYDKNGNVVNWWMPETKKAFNEKAQCIVKQYGNFSVPGTGLNLNGINTQGENIADNGGIKEAYLAYKKWTKGHDPEPSLPGLNFTPEQMFWIAAGNSHCAIQKAEDLKMKVLSDPHSPNYFRANVPLMNSEYFARDFKCPLGSKMNPYKKCPVW